MKKIACLLIFLLAISLLEVAPAAVKKRARVQKFNHSFSLAIGAGVRNFMGDEEDVYGFANLVFSLDAAFRFHRSFEVFLRGEFLQAKGELTITKEETTLRIIPVEAGSRFLFGNSSLLGYLGAGLGYYLVHEDNPIGTVNKNGVGIFAEGGLRYFLVKNLYLDLKLKYVFLSLRPESTSVNLGGPSALGGIGLVF